MGLNVWAYTGYTFEQLQAGFDQHPEWKKLLSLTDVLVDGRFVQEQRTLECPWRGSSNQRLLDMKATLEAGEAVAYVPAQ